MSAPRSRLIRRIVTGATKPTVRPSPIPSAFRFVPRTAVFTQSRCFSVSRPSLAGIMPESDDPPPPKEEAAKINHHATEPTPIDDESYHAHADVYMNAINERAEQLQESREDVEVEYSAGVLSITFPPNGTYVINKQPPNKQIWLASPLSGPKRFDWVLSGESMDHKEGTGQGEWIYLRDGTTLSSVLHKELGLLVDPHAVDTESESKDMTE